MQEHGEGGCGQSQQNCNSHKHQTRRRVSAASGEQQHERSGTEEGGCIQGKIQLECWGTGGGTAHDAGNSITCSTRAPALRPAKRGLLTLEHLFCIM